MLQNDYFNLYQSEFYQKAAGEYSDRDEFERRFALANVLYVHGLKCIGFTGRNEKGDGPALVMVLRNDNVINQILTSENSAFDLLKEADEYEREAKPASSLTCIQASILACEDHINRLDRGSVMRKILN